MKPPVVQISLPRFSCRLDVMIEVVGENLKVTAVGFGRAMVLGHVPLAPSLRRFSVGPCHACRRGRLRPLLGLSKVGAGRLGVGGLIAATRIVILAHWTTDVLAGLAMGAIIERCLRPRSEG
jgi:hypothetical protein